MKTDMKGEMKFVARKGKFTAKEIARMYRVPYWIMGAGPRPSWLRSPLWHLRALWWGHRWDRTFYNGHGEFKNGIVWWRYTSGPLAGWGVWRLDSRSTEVIHVTEPEGPAIWVGYFRGHELWILKPDRS